MSLISRDANCWLCFLSDCICALWKYVFCFLLKPSNIKLSSLYAQLWLFIDTNLLIVMPSWLYSIIFLVVCEFADDCLTCMLHRNVAGCWRAWKNQSQEGSGGHEALCICGSWCFRHGWHMWVWSDFMLSKIRHENKFPKFENDGKFLKRFLCLTSCRFPFPTSSFLTLNVWRRWACWRNIWETFEGIFGP